MSGEKLLPCWHCGGEVAIALHSNEFGEYWWSVQRGHDDATACKCRLFMESEKFCLDVEEGEQAKDSPWAMELRARLVERWNARVAVTDYDFNMAVHDGKLWGKCSECKERQGYYLDAETIRNQQERIAELERSLEHYRLEVICYENDVDARDELICDMARELRGLNDGGISTDCMEHEQRMRELGIEV